ncbi:MAG: methyltransferase [Firmicutes bacterium]|nr:methyltransferase [Bacillota bacterium]
MNGRHYFSDDPSLKSDEREIEYEVGGRVYRFLTDHGVFSMERVDFGTDVLIKTVLGREAEIPGRIIDIGCGYGPIGIVLAERYGRECVMLDVNGRAMELARKNAEANGVSGRVKIGREDELRLSDGCAELIVTNPPIRAGKETVYSLFGLASRLLAGGGRFYAVIRKSQGAQSAERELARIFGSAETVGRKAGYHVIMCEKK